MRINEILTKSVQPGTSTAAAMLKSVITPVYNKNKPIIEKRFNNGLATCTYATKVVSDALSAANIPHKVIEGQFNNDEHWWVAALGFFIDIGDNISNSSVETGNVPMKIVPAFSSGYSPEKSFSAEEYAKYYPSIANW